MTRTSIEWVRNQDGSQGFTVNPIRFRNTETGKVGHYCEKVSPGCKNCYASRMQKGPYLSGLEFTTENKNRGELFFDKNVLQQVLRRRKPSTFFWCDMTDLFGPWVPDDWIDRIAATCALTPWHRHLWLTKRAKRMWEWSKADERINVFDHIIAMSKDPDLPDSDALTDPDWPFANLGLGVSAEDQERADERIPDLLVTSAAMRFVSVEPMLGAVADFHVWRHATKIDWVIVGGESGPGARPMRPDWPRSIRDQCQTAGVPFFFKQWGEWSLECESFHKVSDHLYSHKTFAWNRDGTPYSALNPPLGSFPSQMMYRVGKKAAGRILDGRTWDEMPEMLK